MRRPALRPSLFVTALATSALAAGLLASGCGGGDDAADLTDGLTAQQVLDRSAQEMAGVDTYRVTARARVDATAVDGAGGGTVGRLLADPVEVSGEGSVERPDAVTFDLVATLGGFPVQANVTKVDGGLYVSLLGRDYQVELPAAQVALVEPAEAAPSLIGWVDAPREVGREEVGGVPTVHIRGGVDVDRVVDDISSLLEEAPGLGGGQAPTAADVALARRQVRRALREGRVDVWIGTEDLLLRRSVAVLRLQGRTDLLPQLRRLNLDVSAELSQFDEPVTITAPPDPEPLDPEGILRLGG